MYALSSRLLLSVVCFPHTVLLIVALMVTEDRFVTIKWLLLVRIAARVFVVVC